MSVALIIMAVRVAPGLSRWFGGRGRSAEQSGRKRETIDAYKKVRDEFVYRHLPPATPAAGAAAKAEFLLAEEKFAAFKAKPLKFTANQNQVKRTFDNFTNDAKTLVADYQKVWDYKDATWTLAAFLRMGDIYYEFAQKLQLLRQELFEIRDLLSSIH